MPTPHEEQLAKARASQIKLLQLKQKVLATHGQIEDYQSRQRIDNANADAMTLVMLETGAIISPSNYPSWRPTKRVAGEINAIGQATILATDGNLGLFIYDPEDTSKSFFGHIHHFNGKVETLYRKPTPSKLKETNPKRKKPTNKQRLTARDEKIASRVMELLGDL